MTQTNNHIEAVKSECPAEVLAYQFCLAFIRGDGTLKSIEIKNETQGRTFF